MVERLRVHFMDNKMLENHSAVVEKVLNYLIFNEVTFYELVGWYHDNSLRGFIKEAGIVYFSERGGVISNVIRDFIEYYILNYQVLKMALYPSAETNVVKEDKVVESVEEEDVPSLHDDLLKYYDISNEVLGKYGFNLFVIVGVNLD